MAQVTREDVVRTAHLARISLTEQEQEHMVEHFLQILTYVEKLDEIATDDVEPATHPLNSMPPILREDIITNSPRPEELLRSSPTCDAKFFKVPKVID